MKTIVISAVNLRKGGTLTILNDCLRAFSEWNSREEHRVVAVVHRKELAFYPHIDYIELPWSVRSWLHRLWCEYVTLHQVSKLLGEVSLWLSLHDTTPRVKAERQAVYCHNPFPFFRWHWQHFFLNYRIVCFALFTKLIYRINIHRNQYIIVQQEWLRKAFQQMFGIDRKKIIVTTPDTQQPTLTARSSQGPVRFIYPAFPDVHKNFECLCEAARLLEKEVGDRHFEVLLTTTPDMNKYSRWIVRKWGDVKSIRLCGFLSREDLYELYADADCLVFPSKVETWGLPISEFKPTGAPMILADLPYAHETAAGGRQVAFFNPENPTELKDLMLNIVEGDCQCFKALPDITYEQPYTTDWLQTIETLIK